MTMMMILMHKEEVVVRNAAELNYFVKRECCRKREDLGRYCIEMRRYTRRWRERERVLKEVRCV